jgi:hypothetical protein
MVPEAIRIVYGKPEFGVEGGKCCTTTAMRKSKVRGLRVSVRGIRRDMMGKNVQ